MAMSNALHEFVTTIAYCTLATGAFVFVSMIVLMHP
jgi:hypothetical protein